MPVDSALGFCPYPTKQSGFAEPGKGAEAEEDRATLGRRFPFCSQTTSLSEKDLSEDCVHMLLFWFPWEVFL